MKRKIQVDMSGQIKDHMFDIEAEQAVLGAILYDNRYYHDVSVDLEPEAFSSDWNKEIYRSMKTLKRRSISIDEVTIGDVLKETEQLQSCGGYAYLAELVDCVPSSGNIKQYAHIVNRLANHRNLHRILLETIHQSTLPGAKPNVLLSEFKEKTAHISKTAEKKNTNIKSIMARSFEKLEALCEAGGGITGQATGFNEIDDLTSGLQDTDLIILAARPSMGKTALALNIIEHVSERMKKKKGVIVGFSFEMGDEQLANRLNCSRGKVDSNKFRSANLSDDDFDNLCQAMEFYGDKSIEIIDDSKLNVFDIESFVAQYDEQSRQEGGEGVALVVVDYLQLVNGSRPNMPREQVISEISRNLKGIAKTYNCPVIALSQLNRELEKRSNKRPIMADLRESGAIEQDADIIMFIYRDEVYNDNSPDKGVAEINFAKHRNGALATIKLLFQGKYTRFKNF